MIDRMISGFPGLLVHIRFTLCGEQFWYMHKSVISGWWTDGREDGRPGRNSRMGLRIFMCPWARYVRTGRTNTYLIWESLSTKTSDKKSAKPGSLTSSSWRLAKLNEDDCT